MIGAACPTSDPLGFEPTTVSEPTRFLQVFHDDDGRPRTPCVASFPLRIAYRRAVRSPQIAGAMGTASLLFPPSPF
jgi:hypothetical protein